MTDDEKALARAALRRFATRNLTPGELEQEIERAEQYQAILGTAPPSVMRDNALALVEIELRALTRQAERLVAARVARTEPPRADFEAAKYVDLFALAEMLGLEPYPSGMGGVIRCPFHGDGMERTPSLRIYAPGWGWHCFGCGLGGQDAVSFVAQYLRCSQTEALRFVEETCDLEEPDAQPTLQAA